MFEKDAEEYTERNHCAFCILRQEEKCTENEKFDCGYYKTYQDGAKFGYNKANEWHYPSQGEYPKDELIKLVTTKSRFSLAYCKFGFWYNSDGEIDEDVIAWKEIVLPKR